MLPSKPCRKATSNAAILDLRWKSRNGITRYLASIPSFSKKHALITIPKLIKQMTLAELHAKMTPPNSNPRSNVNVAPTIAMLPSQSTAFNPATKGVAGSSNIKNREG
jgi:hypothetical protein